MAEKHGTAIEWRRVPGFPDYEVSEFGAVRRCTRGKGTHIGRMLRTPVDAEGYPTVNLNGAPRRVHVLVARAFVGPIPPGAEVHHLNENRLDPRRTNLEIVPSKRAHGERHRGPLSDRQRHGEPNPLLSCACGCGALFLKYDADGRPRRFVSGHNITHDQFGRFAALAEGR